MRSIRSLAVIAAVLVAPLAACDDPERAVHIAPKQPRADRATAMHGVAFAPARAELSGAERQRLTAFVQELPTERPRVTLLTSPDSPSLQVQRAAGVRRHLQTLGVSTASVTQAKGLAIDSDTVVVSAESYSARALNCPDWSKSGTYDPLNLPHSNLGCANANNLADMVVNPRDLEVGRSPTGPASGHLGATAVDRLYNDKVKVPPSGGSSASGGGGSGGAPGGGGGGS